MTRRESPLVVLAGEGEAVVIGRNLPEPVAYRGKNFIELEFLGSDDDPKDFFKEPAFATPPGRGGVNPFVGVELGELTTTVTAALRGGFTDRRIFPNVRSATTTFRFVERTNPGTEISGSAPVSAALSRLEPEEVALALKAGKRIHVYQNLYGNLTYKVQDEPQKVEPHLYLLEQYQLSTQLGQYGAGRVVKTFSLLPGERAKISVRSFLKTESERKQASSILDSVTEESATDFQSTLETEQSDKAGYEKSFDYHAEAEAKASWGWGSAKVSGGVKSSTNATREEFSKNVSKAVEQHAAKASAKRDVEINTSFEVRETTEEETSIEREVENINVSRTLNFVFRQMNQEFFSVLHLIDVRVAFFNGFGESRREVPLHQLDDLLAEFVQDSRHAEVHAAITASLGTILDFQGDPNTDFVEAREVDGESYTRVNRELISNFTDPITDTSFAVPGIITAVSKNVMRTEGVIVESLLGEANALDDYARQLQELELERRRGEVETLSAKAERSRLLNEIVNNNDVDRARLLEQLTCPCGQAQEAPLLEPGEPDGGP